jgi:hypothetical protein
METRGNAGDGVRLDEVDEIDGDDDREEKLHSGFTCSVCLEDETEENRAKMPCCSRDTSTIAYCRRCVEIICERSPGHVGRCPTCNKFIAIDSSGSVSVTERVAACAICRQERTIIDLNCCSPCLLGRRYALVYECNRCHQLQRIPHPMWNYQPTPQEFGTDSWACHRGCGTYTHWRIEASEVEKIPAQECPEGWGRREEWIAEVSAFNLFALPAAHTSHTFPLTSTDILSHPHPPTHTHLHPTCRSVRKDRMKLLVAGHLALVCGPPRGTLSPRGLFASG